MSLPEQQPLVVGLAKKMKRARVAVVVSGTAMIGAFLVQHFAPRGGFPFHWVFLGVSGVAVLVVAGFSTCPFCSRFLSVDLLWGNGCPHCGRSFREG